MRTTGGTPNVGISFEGDSWLLGGVFFLYEGAVRRTPLEGAGGMVLRGGERLRVGVTGHELIPFRSGHGEDRWRRFVCSERREELISE